MDTDTFAHFCFINFIILCVFFFYFSDDDYVDQKQDGENSNQRAQAASLETPQHAAAIEHKKGYMMRKCCYESNYKKSGFHFGVYFIGSNCI